MNELLILLAIIASLFVMLPSNEQFLTKYDKFQLSPSEKLNDQRYLSFLSDVQSQLGNLYVQGDSGKCSNKQTSNAALRNAFEILEKNTSQSTNFSRDPCVAYSNYLCEFTDPDMYLTEGKNAPPRWIHPLYKDSKLPYYTFLNCYNATYNCCKSAYKK